MQEQKTERIDIRTSTSTKAILQQAASSMNKTVSEFLLENGLNAAAEALTDRRVFLLDDDQWQEFNELLDRPVQRKPELEKLLNTTGIFD